MFMYIDNLGDLIMPFFPPFAEYFPVTEGFSRVFPWKFVNLHPTGRVFPNDFLGFFAMVGFFQVAFFFSFFVFCFFVWFVLFFSLSSG